MSESTHPVIPNNKKELSIWLVSFPVKQAAAVASDSVKVAPEPPADVVQLIGAACAVKIDAPNMAKASANMLAMELLKICITHYSRKILRLNKVLNSNRVKLIRVNFQDVTVKHNQKQSLRLILFSNPRR
ncbi:MAG: hypothetical protein RIE06_24735 [Roseibium album]|uniref:hypothetical protein n=1 Tax=Roseibium album TaxID=311410 RepID=UPI00131A5B86|nr:hypothetical protein [Labrenzia sp. EL_142]MCR9061830.1 hypothetical protein [Paracoccaceae bacterium]